MSKFLKLIEQNNPQPRYTVQLLDPNGEVVDTIVYKWGGDEYSLEAFNEFRREYGVEEDNKNAARGKFEGGMEDAEGVVSKMDALKTFIKSDPTYLKALALEEEAIQKMYAAKAEKSQEYTALYKEWIVARDHSAKVLDEFFDTIYNGYAEDSETLDIQKAARTAAAVLAIPDQGIGKQLMNPAARKVQSAKRQLASKLKKAVDQIQF